MLTTNKTCLLVLLTLGVPLAGAPGSGPLIPADYDHAKSALYSAVALQEAIRDRHQFEATAKSVGPLRLEDVVEISNLQGQLRVAIHPPPAVLELAEAGRLVILEIGGSDGLWTIGRTVPETDKPNAHPDSVWTLSRIDYDQRPPANPDAAAGAADDGFWHVSVSVSAAGVSIQTDLNAGASIRYAQDAKSARLSVALPNAPLNLDAPTLGQLFARHPEELSRYLAPLLRRLCGQDLLGPGAADVYAVFDQLQPDAAVVLKLQKALEDIESTDAEARAAAGRELSALGSPGVLAALRLPADALSAEQRISVTSLIAQHRHQPALDPAAARKDAIFLAQCLTFPDPLARKAAKEALEKLLNRPINIDIDDAPEARAKAVNMLLREIRTSATKPS